MAFAAVCSVAQILDQMLQHQGFILENREQVEDLFRDVTSLQAIVENSSQKISDNITCLSSQIVSAAYRARDLVESHIKLHMVRKNSLILSSRELLHQATGEIDFIEQQLMEIYGEAIQDLQPIIGRPARKIGALNLYEYAISIWARLMSKGPMMRSTICIVGMAEIGKTIVARLIFNHPEVEELYQVRAWVTVSQSNDVRQIMIDILDSMGIDMPESEYTSQQLREYFYRSLQDMRYLIVLDDLCDARVLDDLYQILPDSQNQSRILVTTRLPNLSISKTPVAWLRMTIIDQISDIQDSREEAESLLTRFSVLYDILKNSSQERKSWENQLLDVAKRVKNFTESCFIEYNITFSAECLTEIKREIYLVKQLVIKIDKEAEAQNLHSSPAATAGNIIAKDFIEIKNKLAEQSSKLKIVSLVGMGGIGKTTLAKQVYNDPFFVQSFLIRAYVTVSQCYDLEQVLCGLLNSMGKMADSGTTEDLSQYLYQSLKGQRYLIVIDDVWDTEVLDDLRRIFPDDKLSSRILLTTRIDKVADYAKSYIHRVHLLNENESWNLFRKKVFGENYCPPQLEKVGKDIVQNCRGLPLAIIVIGGFLSKGTRNPDYWVSIAKNFTSSIFSNEDDHCSKILLLSYTHLPDHLKKCFLYTGMFLEDSDIRVSKLVRLWVAEGFLETLESNKLMEDTAYESLLDLISRSLLSVGKRSSTGKIKTCKLHDVVREFCTREAKLKIFLYTSDISLHGIPTHASVPFRLSIHPNKRNNIFPCDDKKLSSLDVSTLHIVDRNFNGSVHHLNPKPLRVFDMEQGNNRIAEAALNELLSYNLQYLSLSCFVNMGRRISIPSMFPFLQTFILVDHREREVEIWNMPQLRHVRMWKLCLPLPLERENSDNVLENLQTLSHVYNFRWSKEAVRRFPNLKRLGISYSETELQDYYLENLVYLHKLEALTCRLRDQCSSLLQILTFPPSLRKLTLEGCRLPWKDMVIIASSLPNLEVLKLKDSSFEGQQWESSTTEEFPKLKFLLFERLNLELWGADSVNFLSLQRLIIRQCKKLKEIPRCIGEIPTLQLIELVNCTEPLADSVKEMQGEQLEYGNDGLEIHIIDQ